MEALTGKLAWPIQATRLKALHAIRARATGTPIARATRRPGVIRRAPPEVRGALVAGLVVMAVSPFHPVPR